ncbi:MAG: hypothetical protein H7067_07095, partial [Burkholderiales bacterium]|nr:hypothetical protein [Opitutaceae bacterium]
MNRKGKALRAAGGLAALALLGGPAWGAAAEDKAAKPPELSLRGFGVFKNLELRNALELLLDEGGARATFDSGFIEDAALVLNSELVEDGFFAAEVEAVWRDSEGVEGRARLDATLSEAMPRGVKARELRLIARPGVRAVVVAVEFTGLTALEVADARTFFQPDAGLFTPEVVRAWSDARMRRGAAELTEALRAQGHAEARVKVAETRLDRTSGSVELRIEVEEGPVWRVTEAIVRVEGTELDVPEVELALVGETWVRTRSLDAGQGLRRRYQTLGFPDVRVEWDAVPGALTESGEREVKVTARVETGPRVRVGEVGFTGAVRTRPELLERRARKLRPGDWFDPAEVEAARLRLARLGVFRRVETREDDVPGTDRRAVVFELREEA